jgi:hypothetical protein
MPPDPDPLAAELAAVRDRAAQITGDHDPADCIGDLGGPCSGHDAERLADAVEAGLDGHHKIPDGPSGGGYCPTCMRIWPCETYRSITRELLGKEDGHD